jgi:hypothetical protein
MAVQKTPHTKTRQNMDPAAADLDDNQLAQDAGRGDDAELYANMDGAQTGGTRAFNANDIRNHAYHTIDRTAAKTGSVATRTPESEQQGITNRSATEESARQRKVVSARPDAQAGVDQEGNKVA